VGATARTASTAIDAGAGPARAATVDNAAAAALFLCSPAAHAVTGQTVRLGASVASN